MDDTVQVTDRRAIGQVVGALLSALGEPTPAEVDLCNQHLLKMGLPTLGRDSLRLRSPEELAPLVPLQARPALVQLLRLLAKDEPIRRRLSESYAALWAQEVKP